MKALTQAQVLELARIVNRWRPIGVSIELSAADRDGLREQLVDAFVAELQLDPDTAERFLSIATSPFYAELVVDDAGKADEAPEVTS